MFAIHVYAVDFKGGEISIWVTVFIMTIISHIMLKHRRRGPPFKN